MSLRCPQLFSILFVEPGFSFKLKLTDSVNSPSSLVPTSPMLDHSGIISKLVFDLGCCCHCYLFLLFFTGATH